MKASRRNLILISAVAGLTSGFTVRWMQHRGSPDGQSSSRSLSPRAAAGGANPNPASPLGRKVSPLAVNLGKQLDVSSGVTRWLAWMEALEKANLSDFPHLARMARSNPVALRMIAARWIELDPNNLFETLIATSGENDASFPRNDLGMQLFEDWAKRDPASAIAALSRQDFPPNMRDMRYTVINSVAANDPELALKTMSEWHLENYGVQTSGIAKWAAANPQHAAEFALAHPAGYTTQSAMEVIGKTWAKTDPDAALTFASGMKDRYGLALATGIVREWAARDLPKAAAWLAAADPSARGRISGPMVEIWAKADTAGAMDWIRQNLSGSSQDEAIGSVLKGAADKDVASAAELVNSMDASTGRAKAAVSVAKKWFPGFDSGKTASPEAVAWLSSLDPASIKHVVEQIQWQWAGSDPKSLCDFLLTSAGQNAPPYAFSGTAREMARKNPEEALNWATSLTGDHQTEAISNVFNEWQGTQPAAVMEWLRKLPASDPRRESYYLATINNYFPGGPEAAVAAKALAAGNTTAAREVVQKLSMPEEMRQQLMARLQLK